jgi:AAA family ATP:ADP antiporter
MPVARSDQNGASLAMLCALILVSVHVAGKAVRDTLFLSHFPVDDLPQMMIAASAASLLAAIGVSRFLSRIAPARAVPPAMVASGLLLFGEWVLVRRAPGLGAIAVYLHLAALSLVLFSGFWSMLNERFDPYTAKGVVARAGAFGCLGGILGGIVAMQVAPRIGAVSLLPMFAALHVLAAGVAFALGGPASRTRTDTSADSGPGGLKALFSSRLLVQMSLLVVLVQGTEQLIDYVFKATAAAAYADEASLVRFFAIFYTATNALAFVLQSSLGPRALKVLGIGGTLALLPAAVALASSAAALFQRIATVSLARGANNVMSTSFFKAGFELLWTPVAPETKRPAKIYVDVGASGLGDLAGSGLVLLLVAGFAGVPHAIMLGLAAALSMGSLLLVAQLHRGYAGQLADNLRSGALTLDSAEVRDGTTARALEESRLTIDRAELMARIRDLDAAGRAPTRGVAPHAEAEEGAAALPAATAETLVACVADLASGEPERVRRSLVEGRGTIELASFAIPLLARHGLYEDAASFLHDSAPRIVGQLNDALLDPHSEVMIRRRVPRALEGAPGRRAIDGLLRGLEDDDFEVRLECARAAARLADAHAELRVARSEVHSLAGRELAASDREWEQRGRRRRDARERAAILEPPDLPLIDRSMEMVFTLLALAWGCEIMGSTLRAAHAGDPTLRGTALEYLQTVLPEKLRRRLVARIPGGDTARPSQRRSQELADALLHSSAALPRGPGTSGA